MVVGHGENGNEGGEDDDEFFHGRAVWNVRCDLSRKKSGQLAVKSITGRLFRKNRDQDFSDHELSCSLLRLVSRKKGAKGMREQMKTRAARLMDHFRFPMVR